MHDSHGQKVHVTYGEVFRGILWAVIIFWLAFSKDIYPTPFVLKYFTGWSGVFWVLVFFIVFPSVEIYYWRKKKRAAEEEEGN